MSTCSGGWWPYGRMSWKDGRPSGTQPEGRPKRPGPTYNHTLTLTFTIRISYLPMLTFWTCIFGLMCFKLPAQSACGQLQPSVRRTSSFNLLAFGQPEVNIMCGSQKLHLPKCKLQWPTQTSVQHGKMWDSSSEACRIVTVIIHMSSLPPNTYYSTVVQTFTCYVIIQDWEHYNILQGSLTT